MTDEIRTTINLCLRLLFKKKNHKNNKKRENDCFCTSKGILFK